jgi:hypothetical protein
LTSPTWIDSAVHACRLGIQQEKEQTQQIRLMIFEKRMDNFWHTQEYPNFCENGRKRDAGQESPWQKIIRMVAKKIIFLQPTSSKLCFYVVH